MRRAASDGRVLGLLSLIVKCAEETCTCAWWPDEEVFHTFDAAESCSSRGEAWATNDRDELDLLAEEAAAGCDLQL